MASTAGLDGFNAEIDIGPTLKWGQKIAHLKGEMTGEKARTKRALPGGNIRVKEIKGFHGHKETRPCSRSSRDHESCRINLMPFCMLCSTFPERHANKRCCLYPSSTPSQLSCISSKGGLAVCVSIRPPPPPCPSTGLDESPELS